MKTSRYVQNSNYFLFSKKKREKHEIHLTHKGGELNGKTYLSTSFGGNTEIWRNFKF